MIDKKTMMKVHHALMTGKKADFNVGVVEITMLVLTIYFWFIVVSGFATLIVAFILWPDAAFTREYFYCKTQGICG